MTDNDSRPHPQESDVNKEVTLNASFSCPYCAGGAEKYSELFDHGTCVNCGAPLEQFRATITEKGEQEIKRSVLLLYSKDDMAKTAGDVVEELKQNGINVIDAHDIIDGSQTSVVSANLAFIMDKTAAVLVIPSEHLDDDPVISTCLNNAITQKVEGSKRLIPIYTQENMGKASFGLVGIAGIDWDGEVHNHLGIDKLRAISHIHQFVDENASKK